MKKQKARKVRQSINFPPHQHAWVSKRAGNYSFSSEIVRIVEAAMVYAKCDPAK